MNEIMIQYGPYTLCFIGGFIGGIIFERLVIAKKDVSESFFRQFVTSVIFGLWAVSMGIDIANGSQNTPFVLHAFMGAVLGAMNHEFGEYILRFFGKK